jgi:peptide/nickel transport system substrate-binding protein
VVLKKMVVAVAATAMTFGLAACGGGSSSGSSGSGSTGTLILGAVVPASTQSAADARWANESPYMQAVYDSLVHLSPTAEPQPWLATEWSLNKDKTVLTLKLRTDVKFTDGTPFNADAAAQNILRFRDGTSPNASNLANVEDAKAVDDATLEIDLKQPDPAILTYLGQNAGLMESPKEFGAKDEQTNPVGSGPYVLDTAKTVVGSKYVYTKNPTYWAPDSVYYDNLTINVLADAQTQVNAIKGGQVTGLNVIDQSTLSQITGAGFTAFPHELDWTGLMLMDRAGSVNPALAKVEVRQAINYAIDRDAMLKAVAQGHGTVTGQVFPETSPGYDAALDTKYPFDPAKAKELLAAAGYPNGFDLALPLLQVGSTTSFDLVKQYLGDVGIKVTYTQLAINDAITAIIAGKYAATFFQLQMDPTAWQEANFLLLDPATFNPFHQPDQTVTDLVKKIQTGSTDEADQATKDLNAYVVDQAWFDPWYRVEGNFAADSKTDVVQQSDNAYPYLWNIKPKA